MITLEFTKAEVATIARLTGNLMAAAFEVDAAHLDEVGTLESIYYKTSEHLDDEETG